MSRDWIEKTQRNGPAGRRAGSGPAGFFDDRYFMYLEDCDWCHKLWEAGWPVYYVHDIIIHHKHMRDSARVQGAVKALIKNKLARTHLLSWLKYMWKWRSNHKYYAA